MRKKILYTLQFFLSEEGTPSIQEKWGNYNDFEIEEKFNGMQIYYLARRFIEKKKLPHFRQILNAFITRLYRERKEAKNGKDN